MAHEGSLSAVSRFDPSETKRGHSTDILSLDSSEWWQRGLGEYKKCLYVLEYYTICSQRHHHLGVYVERY